VERSGDVAYAFELLLSELVEVEKSVREAGAEASRCGDTAAVDDLSAKAKVVTRLQEDLQAKQAEWRSVWGAPAEHPTGAPKKTSKTFTTKLSRGIRTQEAEYRRPILQALVDLGGQAPIGQVLDRVHSLMKGCLKPVDYEPVPSDAKRPRWGVAAQFERYAMVRDGLLRSDSPRGTWAITTQGRQYLRSKDGQASPMCVSG